MRSYRIKRVEEINVFFKMRRNYKRQLHRFEKDPSKDTQVADLVEQIDQIDQTLLANVPAFFQKQVTQLSQS
jgi:hypothetical protein